ncbi:ArsR/SmtB family transcription factor [Streptomyces termitum]|uniref:ArsR/SmtB family transcription factor n=1 Tax=Streptomyces termitum TaxID=67368 RepID=UPI0033AEB9A2
MQVPLYQAKAEFFRMLGHPVRIRVLELLQHGPVPVRDLLDDIAIEPSSLSQQLAVLRRSGIVVSLREGSTVRYALAGGDVADLLRAARRILTELLAGQSELLAELRQADASAEGRTVDPAEGGAAGRTPGPVEERGAGPVVAAVGELAPEAAARP